MSDGQRAAQAGAEAVAVKLKGTRGPHDDFFCHRYLVWYRVDDCLYRVTHRSFPGCENCFQGHLNQRFVEQGRRPPEVLPPDRGTPREAGGLAEIIPLRGKAD